MINFNAVKKSFEEEDCHSLDALIREQLQLSSIKLLNFKKHPLGFFYIKLFENKINALRLHLWLKGTKPQNKHLLIHNHNFNLYSYVFWGKIINTNYKIQLNNGLEGSPIYEASYDSTYSYLRKTIFNGIILKIENKTVKQGKFYSVLYPDFHKSSIGMADFSITLAITHQTKSNNLPQILSTKKNNPDIISYERKIMPIEADFEDVLGRIINTIT